MVPTGLQLLGTFCKCPGPGRALLEGWRPWGSRGEAAAGPATLLECLAHCHSFPLHLPLFPVRAVCLQDASHIPDPAAVWQTGVCHMVHLLSEIWHCPHLPFPLSTPVPAPNPDHCADFCLPLCPVPVAGRSQAQSQSSPLCVLSRTDPTLPCTLFPPEALFRPPHRSPLPCIRQREWPSMPSQTTFPAGGD